MFAIVDGFSDEVSYVDIVGGVTVDPPHGNGLVNKIGTLEAADRFLALTIFVLDSTVRPQSLAWRAEGSA